MLRLIYCHYLCVDTRVFCRTNRESDAAVTQKTSAVTQRAATSYTETKTRRLPLKPLICDLPYPTLDNLTTDVKSGQILSFAYATQKGELAATLQYLYHEVFMKNFSAHNAETLFSIALAEMKHLHILAEAMERLGVVPRYVQYPNTKIYFDATCVSQSMTPQKMIMDDIQGELNAIAEYNKMLFVLKNEEVEAIISRIILDEQLHLETLKQMLENVKGTPAC